MMPNLNNLAATLVSEKGETLAKSSKAKIGKSSDFTSIFGNSKTKKSTISYKPSKGEKEFENAYIKAVGNKDEYYD